MQQSACYIQVESSDGAEHQGIPAHRQQGGKKVAPKQTQRSSLPSSKRRVGPMAAGFVAQQCFSLKGRSHSLKAMTSHAMGHLCVQLAKALDYRKPGFADPHSNLQARHHASLVSATSEVWRLAHATTWRSIPDCTFRHGARSTTIRLQLSPIMRLTFQQNFWRLRRRRKPQMLNVTGCLSV